MRIFKNKWFARFAKKEGIDDKTLIDVIANAEVARIDADYGGDVIKQRIARAHEGKSGGYRTVILFREGDKAFFIYGFAKKDLDNIDKADVKGFKKLAKVMLSLSDGQLEMMLKRKEIEEITQ